MIRGPFRVDRRVRPAFLYNFFLNLAGWPGRQKKLFFQCFSIFPGPARLPGPGAGLPEPRPAKKNNKKNMVPKNRYKDNFSLIEPWIKHGFFVFSRSGPGAGPLEPGPAKKKEKKIAGWIF